MPTLDKVLIANRGEILRILRIPPGAGIHHRGGVPGRTAGSCMRLADESVCIGPPSSKDSYLNVPASSAPPEVTNATAITRLAENADFAEQVEKSGYVFIGPHRTPFA